MFYNWYDPATLREAAHLARERQPGQAVPVQRRQRLAGHRAAARRARRAVAGRRRPTRSASDMDFGCYYNEAEGQGGQIRGGFWDEDPSDAAAGHRRLLRHGHGRLVHRPPLRRLQHRAADRVLPRHRRPARSRRKHYFGTFRTFPNDNCDWAWTETKPVGRVEDLRAAIDVFEGALPYRGMNVVPTWGGSMFEALMVPLFVPEETWGPRSWGVNHPLYVAGQIEHGMDEAELRLLGLLAVQQPGRRLPRVRRGHARPGRAPATPPTRSGPTGTSPTRAAGAGQPAPTAYGDGVVTPHASFLALRYAPRGRAGEPGATSSATSTPTARAGSTTPSRSRSGRSRSATCRSTRAWSWPRSATRWPATTCAATSSRRRDGASRCGR